MCHEIFDPLFFHPSTPPRALIHGLKPFRIPLRIRRDYWFENRRNRNLRSKWDCGIRFHGLIETSGSDPAVSMKPLNPLPRFNLECGPFYKNVRVGFPALIETAETDPCLIETAESELYNFVSRLCWRKRNHMQNVFSLSSGPKGELFDEKTEGQKSRNTVPLSRILSLIIDKKFHF
jgi:hypothetical protein